MPVDPVEALIEAVKLKPEIYNKALSLHQEKDTIDKDWETIHEIVTKMGHVTITVAELKKIWSTLFTNFKTAYNYNIKLPRGHEFDEQKCEFYEQLMFLANYVQNRETKSTSVWSNKRKSSAIQSSQPPKVPKFDNVATEKLKQYQFCAENVGNLQTAVENHTNALMQVLNQNEDDDNFNIFYSEFELINKLMRSACYREIVAFLQSVIKKSDTVIDSR